MFKWKSDFSIGSQGWKLLEFSRLKSRLLGGEGPQLGEVNRSGGVKTLPAFTRNLTTTPSTLPNVTEWSLSR